MQERQHPRYAAKIAVTMSDADGAAIAVRTKDMSLGGTCLYADRAWRVGDMVTLRLPHPDAATAGSAGLGPAGGGTPIAGEHPMVVVTARVVWVTPIDREFQLGLVFVDLTDTARWYVQGICNVLRAAQEPLAKPAKRTFDVS